MKVEVKEVGNEGFKPFKIEIEVESLAELKDLHNRINIASYVVNDKLNNNWCNADTWSLWDFLKNELKKYK